MSTPTLSIGRTDDGYVIRVDGRGTARESPTFQQLVDDSLQEGEAAVTVDLSRCTYLDSTFLGCLVTLNQHFSKRQSSDKTDASFAIVAPPETRKLLFKTSHLEKVLPFVDTGPELIGEAVAIDLAETGRDEFGRHVASVHRALAALGGDQAEAFAQIAEQIEQELDGPKTDGPQSTESTP
jgi:anti-anti-sigma factor